MKKMIAQLLIPMTLSLLISFASQAADKNAAALVNCQIAHPKVCKDCKERIPASCEENGFTGSLSAKLKPAKVQWLVSNSKKGTERIVTTENKTLTLKDLQTSKNLASLASKQKVSLQKNESIALAGVQVTAGTELFKGQTGKEIAAKLQAANPQRAIASESREAHAGGVGRASQLKANK